MRRPDAATDVVYDAAQRWRDQCLRDAGSLFTPGRPIWTDEHFAVLRERFIDNPDTSQANFITKLRGQLENADDAAIRRLIEHMQAQGDVWFATLGEIADHVNALVDAGRWTPRVEKIPFYSRPVIDLPA